MVKSSKLDGALYAATVRPPTNCDDEDVVANSIISLQSVQKALEKEVQKFEELGRVYISASDSYCTGPASALHDPTISEYNLFSGEVHKLKSKLEEVSAMIKAKEHQIIELESILDGSDLLQNTSAGTSDSLEENYREMEIELDCLFKQKIEFEIEFLIVSKTTQRLSVTAEDRLSLFEEQKSLAGEQIQMMHKLKDAEHKAVVLKNKAEELEASREQMLDMEEVLEMQNKVYVYTTCLAAQIVLLLSIVFVIFIMRPRTYGVVPT